MDPLVGSHRETEGVKVGETRGGNVEFQEDTGSKIAPVPDAETAALLEAPEQLGDEGAVDLVHRVRELHVGTVCRLCLQPQRNCREKKKPCAGEGPLFLATVTDKGWARASCHVLRRSNASRWR